MTGRSKGNVIGLYKAFSNFNGRGLVEEKEYKAEGLEPETDPFPWRWSGVGRWLLTYDCEKDVAARRRAAKEQEVTYPQES
jgi:salicylate hydroxylase